jgi:hypothetical protein
MVSGGSSRSAVRDVVVGCSPASRPDTVGRRVGKSRLRGAEHRILRKGGHQLGDDLAPGQNRPEQHDQVSPPPRGRPDGALQRVGRRQRADDMDLRAAAFARGELM